jgi:hypothetical protein
MRNLYRPLIGITRLTVVTLAALAVATPASAQFGGLKKKIKKAAGQEDQTRAAEAAPVDQGEPGGTIVLTEEVLSRLVTGLKAGQVERDVADKADTPYGRYRRAAAAYATGKSTCEEARKTFPQRMMGDKKLSAKYNAVVEKMVAAQKQGDQKTAAMYNDSALAIQDPGCVVKEPDQPENYYEAQREVDVRAEALERKAAGFSHHELAVVKERAISILLGRVDEEASPSEKSAVTDNKELIRLLGFRERPPETAKKEEPKPAPAPEPVPASPQMSAQASDMSACMVKNMQKNQARIEALGKQAQAAQKAGDQAKMMAIADTIQRIQMAGCTGR